MFLIILIASTNHNFNATIKLYNEVKQGEDEISSESLFQQHTSNFLPKALNKRPTTTIFFALLIIVIFYIWRLFI
ncbi:hypothetical protein DXX92_04635 [Thalassotalea euphylliae]|uniref:Uncharacterized protein n=1 Tax=Thalassotalea euphylliae TaxID=1655234 RepID=A0A3E0UCZ0_9GAMM|nr:hypothetical protein DXX92_04635 [Thalassotalea euphylliae]